MLGRLNYNRGDAGDLSSTVITGTYTLPTAGKGQFQAGIDTSEGSPQAFRRFTFNAFGGEAQTFNATYAGGGPDLSDLKRSFTALPLLIHQEGGRTYYLVRWYYEATLLGPTALPSPGLVLKFRYSRAISPPHWTFGPPNVVGVPLRHISLCRPVYTKSRQAVIGFNCTTYSLGVRHGLGNGWLVQVGFGAYVPAGAPHISATITNRITDKFTKVPAVDLTPLTAGKKIPAGPGGGSGVSFTGDWRAEFTTNPSTVYQSLPGTYTFRHTGSTVCGRYDFSGGGTVTGTVRGRTLTGSSVDRDFGRSTFTATLAADGQHWDGTWQRGTLSGHWRGTRVGAPTRRC